MKNTHCGAPRVALSCGSSFAKTPKYEMSCASLLFGSEFSAEEIAQTKAAHGLLTMEVEVGTACNFRCKYCYVGDGSPAGTGKTPELSPEEIRGVIAQAQALGARKIILLGGEPMIYDFTPELCEWIRGRDLAVEMFTNGTNMTPAMASRLFKLGVHVVLKWHTSDHQIQNWLAGVPGAADIMAEAYRNLRAAGYPSSAAKMALSTVICRQNIAELPGLWQWMRAEGIEPYFEMITPQGRARKSGVELSPDVAEIRQLFETIREIDRVQYGRTWEAQPPLVGNTCLRHSFSCLVAASGDVMPCVGVSLPVGNVRERPLADILADSEVIADLRDHEHTIQGACGVCDKAATCYGCRGAAYQLTGNYLGSDPLCWRNQGTAVDCGQFPIDAARLVPHQAPARMIDALLAVAERSATVSATIEENNPHCRAGRLAEAAHVELMAQAAAALHGYRSATRPAAAPQRGMLVGARNLEIREEILVGDHLTVRLHKQARLGTFGVIDAEVHRGETLVSKAELKTWHEK